MPPSKSSQFLTSITADTFTAMSVIHPLWASLLLWFFLLNSLSFLIEPLKMPCSISYKEKLTSVPVVPQTHLYFQTTMTWVVAISHNSALFCSPPSQPFQVKVASLHYNRPVEHHSIKHTILHSGCSDLQQPWGTKQSIKTPLLWLSHDTAQCPVTSTFYEY